MSFTLSEEISPVETSNKRLMKYDMTILYSVNFLERVYFPKQ